MGQSPSVATSLPLARVANQYLFLLVSRAKVSFKATFWPTPMNHKILRPAPVFGSLSQHSFYLKRPS